jgi:hypothetical protein
VTNYVLYAHTKLLSATNLSAAILRLHVGEFVVWILAAPER